MTADPEEIQTGCNPGIPETVQANALSAPRASREACPEPVEGPQPGLRRLAESRSSPTGRLATRIISGSVYRQPASMYSAAIAVASAPQNNSSPITSVGTPKTPRP